MTARCFPLSDYALTWELHPVEAPFSMANASSGAVKACVAQTPLRVQLTLTDGGLYLSVVLKEAQAPPGSKAIRVSQVCMNTLDFCTYCCVLRVCSQVRAGVIALPISLWVATANSWHAVESLAAIVQAPQAIQAHKAAPALQVNDLLHSCESSQGDDLVQKQVKQGVKVAAALRSTCNAPHADLEACTMMGS